MATREAPRKPSKIDKEVLAGLRKRGYNVSYTDYLNTLQQKNYWTQAMIDSARGIPINRASPKIDVELVDENSKGKDASVFNLYQQGRSLEGLFGNQVNEFGEPVNPTDQATYRETFGRNPVAKIILNKGETTPIQTGVNSVTGKPIYKDVSKEFSFYDTTQPRTDWLNEMMKSYPAMFATSADKFIRGITGAFGIDNVSTAPIWTFGGTLADNSEFDYVSRKGDKKGIADDLLNAADLATYFAGGTGTVLKAGSLGFKLAKAAKTANRLKKASTMNRYTLPFDIGGPFVAAPASRYIGDRISTSTVADDKVGNQVTAASAAATIGGLLALGLSRGKLKKAAIPAGVGAGAIAFSGMKPEDAEAASLSGFAKALSISETAARAYARRQAKSITRRHRNRVWKQAFGENAKRPTGKGWWDKPEYAGLNLGDKVTTEEVYQSLITWLEKAKAGDPLAIKILGEPIDNYNALHWGHFTALKEGGKASTGRFIPGSTNLKAGVRSARKHTREYAEQHNISYSDAWKALGYNKRFDIS